MKPEIKKPEIKIPNPVPDETFKKGLKIARKAMRTYRNALRKLAE